MAGKTPAVKLQNILGQKIIKQLNRSKVTKFDVIYSKEFIEIAIKSLEAFITEFKVRIASQKL